MVDSHKAQHTPGPWRFRFIQLDGNIHASALLLETSAPNRPANDPCILAVREDWIGWLRHTEIGQSDARLIEAAPDMLETLRAIVAILDQPVQRTTSTDASRILRQDARTVRQFALSAIARATGSTPQGTAAAVAEALGRSPSEPGTARLAADLGE